MSFRGDKAQGAVIPLLSIWSSGQPRVGDAVISREGSLRSYEALCALGRGRGGHGQ